MRRGAKGKDALEQGGLRAGSRQGPEHRAAEVQEPGGSGDRKLQRWRRGVEGREARVDLNAE